MSTETIETPEMPQMPTTVLGRNPVGARDRRRGHESREGEI